MTKFITLILPLIATVCLVSCTQYQDIDNQFLTAKAPVDYVDISDLKNNDVLFLDRVTYNDLESIFSIDNIQDNLLQENSETIKDDTPIEVLTIRLRIIEKETKDPHFAWKKFVMVQQPKEITFKGYKAAEATFTVDENVNSTGRIVKRKIKRMVLFTNKDLWNFVLAPSEMKYYDKEMKIFDDILKSIEIKK